MQRRSRRAVISWMLICSFLLCLPMPARAKSPADGLTTDDEKAIRATIEAYRSAWLANDAKGVLRTFTEDAVLQPAHGARAVVGIAAIEKYWFTPGGPPTTITVLNITVDQIGGLQGPCASVLSFAQI